MNLVQVLDIVTEISAILFLTFSIKLWRLIKHKSLFIYIIAGFACLALRTVVMLGNWQVFTTAQTLPFRTILSVIFFTLLAVGSISLYLEVKKVLGKG